MVVGEAGVGSEIDVDIVLVRVNAGLQSALSLNSVSALRTSGQMQQETQDSRVPGLKGGAGSWHLDCNVRIQPMVTGLDQSQIEKTRELGWLDLELGSLGINSSLNLELLGEVDVGLVRRVNNLGEQILRFFPLRILWKT